MRVIKTLDHVSALRSAGTASPGILKRLQDDLVTLLEELQSRGTEGDPFGAFLLLEPGDPVDDLAEFGLPQGLLGTTPDLMDRFELGSETLFRAVKTLGNECAISVYFTGDVDPRATAWAIDNLPDLDDE